MRDRRRAKFGGELAEPGADPLLELDGAAVRGMRGAGDVVRAPLSHVRAAVTDPADIAAVAAVALTRPGHEGRVYEVSGPEPLTAAERVAILGQALGRNLRFEAQPDEEARAEMSATMPAKYVDAFFDFYVRGTLDESKVLPTVQDLPGRPPRTFAQWAAAHADAFH